MVTRRLRRSWLSAGALLSVAGCLCAGLAPPGQAAEQEIRLVQEGTPAMLPAFFPKEPPPGNQPSAFDAGTAPGPIPAGPRRIEDVLPVAAASPVQGPILSIDFSRTLAIVAGQNPEVAFAHARHREAYAQWQAARILWLPSVRAGVSYHKHDGRLQDARGQILDISRSSLQAGMGAYAVGAGTAPIPGVVANFGVAEAIFEPRVTGYAAAARSNATRTTLHDILLETALAYQQLLRAVQLQAIVEETAANSQQLAELTENFARTGQGLKADAERARVELMLRRTAVAQVDEEIAVASARLIQLLHVRPETTLIPQEPAVVPIELVAVDVPRTELLSTGLSNRPELAEARNLVCEAVNRYRREQWSPWLPSALLATSYTGFGGGQGSDLDDFGDRVDFDAVAFWEIRNLGFGERAARNRARAQMQQAEFEQIRRMDEVAREVVEGHAQVLARQRQISLAEQAVQSAVESYRLNVERIRDGQGLPIEVLQAIQALDQTRREYLRAVVAYNEAQFRLQRALGWPVR